MTAPAVSLDKRRRIESLWKRLRHTKTRTLDYEAVLSEIRALSIDCDTFPHSRSLRKGGESARPNDQKTCLDRAHAIVRVSIDGLNEEAAQRALKRGNREAMRRLEAPIRSKKLQYPITLRMLDNTGSSIASVTDLHRQVNRSSAQGFLFYLVAEDGHGRRVCARIELVRQVIQ
jgi:hypothetical protein